MRVLGEQVVSGQQIVEVLLAGHGFLLCPGLRMATQVERQADATKPGDAPRARQIALLTTAPAMHEQYAGHLFRR